MTVPIAPARMLVGTLTSALLLIASGSHAQSAQSTADPTSEEAPDTQGRAEAQTDARTGRRLHVLFDDRPALEIGDTIRVELGLRLDTDIRTDDARDVKRGQFAWNGRRLELAGKVTDRIDFEVSRDLEADETWRDAFVDVRATRRLSVRAGRFKVPFSDERLRSVGRIDFVNRSMAADVLTPGRSDGVMARGEAGERVEYAVGLFRDRLREGNERDPIVRDRPGDPLGAARVTVRPFAAARDNSNDDAEGATAGPAKPEGGSGGASGRESRGDASRLLRSLRVGLSVLRGSNGPSLTTLGAATFDANDGLFEPVYVNGPRTGIGTEVRWSPGPLRLSAEWMDLREARHGQALDGRDLRALHGRGWYTSAIWRVARWRHRNDHWDDHWLARSLLREVEVGARFETLAFGTGPGSGAGVAAAAEVGAPAVPDGVGAGGLVLHPRSDLIPWQRLRVLTLGTTWRLNRFSRIQLNAIGERPDAQALTTAGATEGPPDGHRTHWSGVIRLQMQM